MGKDSAARSMPKRHGSLIYYERPSKTSKKDRKFRIRDNNIFNRVMGRMKRWFKDVI